MEKKSQDILLETYSQEYDKHSDEIQNRIAIQNQMAERAINITVMLVSVLAALFTFFMKDFDASSLKQRTNLFISVCVPVLLTHGILTQLTLAAWIYQLSMMFRIVRYWNWTVETRIEPMIGEKGVAYLWDRHPNPPWDMPVDTKVVRYFQPLFVYGLCSVMLVGLPLAWWWCPLERGFRIVRAVAFVGSISLAASLFFLAFIHLKVVQGTEAFRQALRQEKTDNQKTTPNNGVQPTH